MDYQPLHAAEPPQALQTQSPQYHQMTAASPTASRTEHHMETVAKMDRTIAAMEEQHLANDPRFARLVGLRSRMTESGEFRGFETFAEGARDIRPLQMVTLRYAVYLTSQYH
ncbi:hypothetical protein QR680_016138 [Steinernema hermaphroditum]|uniref:Uncharacterized protein n=1 Tax=Steinernema hermaphroditum TaxID=289476 RepID=A0AA39HB48_9BILA|nr:hypothetical protein QR680_016138 [Steinernema hermaphroditum]